MGTEANWDDVWTAQGIDVDDVMLEERTVRWQAIERHVISQFGGFDHLSIVEIGSGHGTNAIQFVRRGARAVLLDNSAAALDGAREVAAALGVSASFEEADLFGNTPELDGRFDVSCSFGLAEHFTGSRRVDVLAAHLRMIRPGGLAIISVPNRWSPPYRLWMAAKKVTGRWEYGTEVPFSESELRRLIVEAGGEVVEVAYGSAAATVHNFVSRPMKGSTTRAVERPVRLDRLAYDMTVFAHVAAA